MDLVMLALLTLAAARATHLVADDKFPFGGLKAWLALPQYIKQSSDYTKGDKARLWAYDGITCTFCVSIHAGFWASWLATYADWTAVNGWGDWPTFMVTWFAIAGGVVLLEGLVFALMGDDE